MSKFQRQPDGDGGWTISTDYLNAIKNRLYDQSHEGDLGDSVPSLEQIEMVLLAVEEKADAEHYCMVDGDDEWEGS